jgi:hypothetical protein
MRGKKVLVILLLTLIGAAGLRSVLVEQSRTHSSKSGLVLVASREGSLGAVSLQLYKDNHFEFWNSGLIRMSKGAYGLYKISGDTLTLEPHHDGKAAKTTVLQRYVISDGALTTIPAGTGLVFLGIGLDRRNELN